MPKVHVSYELLEELDACEYWLDRLNDEFPNGVDVDFTSPDDFKMLIDRGFRQVLSWLDNNDAVDGGDDRPYRWVLDGADLSGINLSRAYLSRASFNGTNLNRANLHGADLISAHLSGADLTGADLISAHLSGADLTGADLTGADLISAYLSGADLTDAKLDGIEFTFVYFRSVFVNGVRMSRNAFLQSIGQM